MLSMRCEYSAESTTLQPKTQLECFVYKMIKPILLFGCEVWGLSYNEKVN